MKYKAHFSPPPTAAATLLLAAASVSITISTPHILSASDFQFN